MSNGQKTKKDSKPARLDIDDIKRRTHERRKKILDGFWIDNIPEINKQIADLPCDDIKDLMLLFGCNVQQLAACIKTYKEKTKF